LIRIQTKKAAFAAFFLRFCSLQDKPFPQRQRPQADAVGLAAEEGTAGLRVIAQLRTVPLQVKRKKLTTPYDKTVTTWEISYNTHDDTWIDAWFSYPAGATEKLPCVVYFHGGSLQKELHLDIVATGVSCFAMDVRGQGGTSIDRAVYHSGDLNGGLMTRGVLDKEDFYMRNIYLDAVRSMDVVASLPEVDPERIVTYGGSQGGGLSVVASALSGHSKKCYTYVTSYCCLKQRTDNGSGQFSHLRYYLSNNPELTDAAMDTLTYFDINNVVSLLKSPLYLAMGLEDPICLPHFVYSVYTHAPVEKTLFMSPFTKHNIPLEYKMRCHFEFSQL